MNYVHLLSYPMLIYSDVKEIGDFVADCVMFKILGEIVIFFKSSNEG